VQVSTITAERRPGQLHGKRLPPEAVDEGLLDLAWMNRLRLFDPIRSDARFEALRQRVRERADRVAFAWRGPTESLDQAHASVR
jgi:hypothetical protein